MTRRRKLATRLGAALLVAAALPLGSQVNAADHADAPGTMADRWADLNDLYAWHTDNGTIVVVLTFNGLLAPDAPDSDTFNEDELPNVLYQIHIDNTADPIVAAMWADNSNDNESDIDINVRFGQNGLGEWGYQFENVPGSSGPIIGPVGEVTTDGTVQVTAGVFDDPFFFDLQGFRDTVMNLDETDENADLGFMLGATVDFFAGTNTMAVVVEMDAAAALNANPDNFIQVWATSGRASR